MLHLSAFFGVFTGLLLLTDRWPSNRSLLVLPTYNERDNIAQIVAAIRVQLPDIAVWIVDDNSPDGTGKIADQIAAEDKNLEVHHRPGKLGLGTAYIESFKRGLFENFDSILQMDADFSHDPKYLPQLIGGLQEADVVVGSRYTAGGGTENWSLLRRVISRGGNFVARIGLGVKTRDATGGFRAFRRSALEQLHLDDLGLRGYGFQIEVIYQAEHRGLRVKEVPIIFVERAAGKSKMSRAIAMEAFLHILRRRRDILLGRKEPEPDAAKTSVAQK
jgi:dolichol-phosphate mannosyltransferase